MTSTHFDDDMVADITREVWAAMVDGSLSAHDEPGAPTAPSGECDLTGAVDINGTWCGTVYLSFSLAAARQAASKMFDAPPDDVTSEDIDDAVGELTNIIGGTLKMRIPQPATLSVPRVTAELPVAGRDGEAEMVSELRFAWLDEPLMIGVWRRPAAAAD